MLADIINVDHATTSELQTKGHLQISSRQSPEACHEHPRPGIYSNIGKWQNRIWAFLRNGGDGKRGGFGTGEGEGTLTRRLLDKLDRLWRWTLLRGYRVRLQAGPSRSVCGRALIRGAPPTPRPLPRACRSLVSLLATACRVKASISVPKAASWLHHGPALLLGLPEF